MYITIMYIYICMYPRVLPIPKLRIGTPRKLPAAQRCVHRCSGRPETPKHLGWPHRACDRGVVE